MGRDGLGWPSGLAWHPRRPWPRGVEAEMGQESILVKKSTKIKVLRMGYPIVENLSGPQESVFNLSRGLQLNFGEKSTNW